MIICVDTCCMINLLNGTLVRIFVERLQKDLRIQGLVEDELITHADEIKGLVADGVIRLIPGSEIFASEVRHVANKHNIGLGESECIALGLKNGWMVASDDGRARTAGIKEIGKERITGSIGILTQLVTAKVISQNTATTAYQKMKRAGGFLPKLPLNYFGPFT